MALSVYASVSGASLLAGTGPDGLLTGQPVCLAPAGSIYDIAPLPFFQASGQLVGFVRSLIATVGGRSVYDVYHTGAGVARVYTGGAAPAVGAFLYVNARYLWGQSVGTPVTDCDYAVGRVTQNAMPGLYLGVITAAATSLGGGSWLAPTAVTNDTDLTSDLLDVFKSQGLAGRQRGGRAQRALPGVAPLDSYSIGLSLVGAATLVNIASLINSATDRVVWLTQAAVGYSSTAGVPSMQYNLSRITAHSGGTLIEPGSPPQMMTVHAGTGVSLRNGATSITGLATYPYARLVLPGCNFGSGSDGRKDLLSLLTPLALAPGEGVVISNPSSGATVTHHITLGWSEAPLATLVL